MLSLHSAKKPHKDAECEGLDDLFDQSNDLNQPMEQAGSYSQSEQGEEELRQSHDRQDADDDEEGRLVIAQEPDEESTTNTLNSSHRSPPPLIKHSSPSRY